jgi:hypothetical protein
MNRGARPAHSYARATGAVYLTYFVVAILGSVMLSRGIAAYVGTMCFADVLYAATTLLFLRLFRHVNALLAVVATLFSLAGCTVDVLVQLGRGPAHISPLLFFGPFCVLLGVLIVQSRLAPRVLGWLMALAGGAWLAYLIPAVALHAKTVILPLGFLAELALMLWLLIRGVDEQRWRATAR